MANTDLKQVESIESKTAYDVLDKINERLYNTELIVKGESANVTSKTIEARIVKETFDKLLNKINVPYYLLKKQHGLTGLLSVSAVNLKEYTKLDTELNRLLLQIQAKIAYILVCFDVNNEMLTAAQTQEEYFIKGSLEEAAFIILLETAISDYKCDIDYESCSIQTKQLLIDVQQKVSFAIGHAELKGVRLDDLDNPLHPYESALLDMIEDKRSKPKKYDDNGVMDATKFYKHYYKKYISANVIFQDFLRKIDDKLLKALIAVKRTNKSECIVPAKKERKIRDSEKKHYSPEAVKKAHRINSL